MGRFALPRQGHNSHLAPRWHALACRGLRLALPHSAGLGHPHSAGLGHPHSAGLGHRPTDLNAASPSTNRRNGFHPARKNRVSTQGDIR
jgi:hypothetical protein